MTQYVYEQMCRISISLYLIMNLHFASGQNISEAYTSPTTRITGYQCNTQYSDFPAKMSDGRSVVASWQPGAVVNEILVKQNGIQSNWQYRKYLMNNSQTIRENLFRDALNDVGYSVRNENPDMNVIHDTPKLYGSINEPVTHRFAESSDLKDTYLNREQLDARRVVPSMTQEEMIRLKEIN
jgi:hypothetical protein